jgi:hypothetical protein
MLNAHFILVFQFLEFFFRRVLAVLLIFCGRLDSLVSVLADEQDLRIGIIEIFRLHLRPREATELLEEPREVSRDFDT